MKAFYMSLRYWASTIFIMTLFTAIWGMIKLDEWTIVFSLFVLFIGAAISFPLVLPCMWLLRITAGLPYSATAKTWWFAVMLSMVYIGMIIMLRPLFYGFFGAQKDNALFYFAAGAIFIVTWLSGRDLDNLYQQQKNDQ